VEAPGQLPILPPPLKPGPGFLQTFVANMRIVRYTNGMKEVYATSQYRIGDEV